MKTLDTSIEHGLMLMKDGMAWGIMYEDPYSVVEGFTDPVDGYLYDPEKVEYIGQITNENSADREEMMTGRLRPVKRITKVKLAEEI